VSAQPAKALFALDDGVHPALVEGALPSGPSVQTVGVVEGLEASWRLAEETSPDLLVVVTEKLSDRVLFMIQNATNQRPDRPIVVLHTGPANGFLQRAFEAGADDLVVLPESADRIRFALEKALARKRGSTDVAGQAPMVCMLGPKGGTGKTLTSCNLTVALAQSGKQAVLVDLDLQFGDVGIALGLSPDRTIYDLARTGGTLDAEKVESFLMTHSSGARVLLAPTRPDQAGMITVDFVRDVLRVLRSMSDVVLVDTPPAFSPEVIATIDSASHLCMVGALDALSLKDSKLGLETLDLMGHKGSKLKFVLNRADTGGGISRRDAETILGRAPDAFIPEDKDVLRGLSEGRPVVLFNERSGASRAFTDLAKTYVAEFEAAAQAQAGAEPAKRRGFSALLRGKEA